MKKLLVAFLMMLVVLSSLMFSASAASSEVCYGFYGTPEIDGTIDDVWNNAEWIDIAYQMGEYTTYVPDRELDGLTRFKILWDDTYLYLLIQNDDINVTATPLWSDFSRIVINERGDKKIDETKTTDWVFSVCSLLEDNNELTVWEWGKNTVDDFWDRMTFAYSLKQAEDGQTATYIYEFRLELKEEPVANRQLGFTISASERPSEKHSIWGYPYSKFYSWSNSIFNGNYDYLGTLILVNSADDITATTESPTTPPATETNPDSESDSIEPGTSDKTSESTSGQDTDSQSTTAQGGESDSVDSDEGGLSTGAVIGIIAAAVVLAVVVVVILKKKRT